MFTELPGFLRIAFDYFILQSSQLSNSSHLIFSFMQIVNCNKSNIANLSSIDVFSLNLLGRNRRHIT